MTPENLNQYQAPATLLKDKIILVTGAGDGIGAAAAKAYAASGATVILLGKTISKLEAVYDAIEAAGHPQPAIYPMHLGGAVMQDYEELGNKIDEEFGHLDGLLHNASILGERRSISQTSVESWNEVMQINVNAQFMLTKALMPLLEAAEQASIIFSSSSVGRQGRAYWGAYAISKFATEGIVQVMADELSGVSKVRVNSLNPKATNTSMRRKAYPAENPSENPSPEDITAAYLYLMGDDSLKVSGQALDAR